MEPRAGGLSADGAQSNAPAPDAPAYDLTTAVADYPPWEGRPRSTLVLAAHPRSGSTLLGEAIHAAGGAGLPLEYFHRGFRPRFAARWRTRSLDAYIGAAHRFRTDPTGVFAVKLFWQDVEDLAVERGAALSANPTPDGYRTLFARIADAIPNPSFIHLRRGDRVRQAVSVLVAQQTGRWRDVPGPPRRPANRAPVYDFERLAGQIAEADRCHRHWANLFAALGVAPLELSYERLLGDYPATVGDLLSRIGAQDTNARTPRLRRQSDPESEAMALRYLREDAARRATAQRGELPD
jgi:LPS sulfotransferase NodH